MKDFSPFLLATSATTASQVSYCHGDDRSTAVPLSSETVDCRKTVGCRYSQSFCPGTFTSSNIQVTLVDSLGFSGLVLWNMWGNMSTKGTESITAAESSPQAICLHSWRSSSGTHLPCPHSFHPSVPKPSLWLPLLILLSLLCITFLAPVSWHNITINFSSSKHRKKRRRYESEEGGMRLKPVKQCED